MRDQITVTLTFERPDTEEALAAAINGMVQALPKRDGRNVRLKIEGASETFTSVFQTAYALTKAQVAARASRRKSNPTI